MKQIAVLGLSRFGISVAKSLEKLDVEVMGVDIDPEKVDDMAREMTHVVQADVLDDDALDALGLRNFDVVVLSIKDVEISCLATINIKDRGVPYIVTQAISDAHAEILRRIGADRVIIPEKDMGARLARRLGSENVIDYMDLSDDYGIMEIAAPDEWTNRTLAESDLRNRHGINVLAIRAANGAMVSPRADSLIRETDVLVVMGAHTDLNKVSHLTHR